MRETAKIAIIAFIVLIFIGILFSTSTFNLTNNDSNNSTNDTQNITLNQANNTSDNSTQNINTNTNTKSQSTNTQKSSQSSKSSSSQSDVHKSYFTVSENEKGQYEGMEPGRYVETWSSDGPISVDKVS